MQELEWRGYRYTPSPSHWQSMLHTKDISIRNDLSVNIGCNDIVCSDKLVIEILFSPPSNVGCRLTIIVIFRGIS